MAKSKYTVEALVAAANNILTMWVDNPGLSLGPLTFEEFREAAEDLASAHAAVEARRVELTGLIDNRADRAAALADLITRVRSGVRAVFGPDSAQYEQAGGTRQSERKPRARPAGGRAPSAEPPQHSL